MMNWGIFLHEMKWDVFFKAVKSPKKHTKSDMIEKEWSFLSKQMHSSLFTSYVSKSRKQKRTKTADFNAFGAAKLSICCFFVSLFGSEKIEA